MKKCNCKNCDKCKKESGKDGERTKPKTTKNQERS